MKKITLSLIAFLLCISAKSYAVAIDLSGDYSGNVKVTLTGEPALSPEGVEFSVKNGEQRSLNFAKFPVNNLVKAIVGEEAAPGILALLGDVAYEIEIQNGIPDAGEFILAPKTLLLPLGDAGVVSVFVAPVVNGSFDSQSAKMSFTLVVDSVYLGTAEEGMNVGLAPITLDFEANRMESIKNVKIQGDYNANMVVTMGTSLEPEALIYSVKNDQTGAEVNFTKFPVDNLIRAILGAGADDVIKLLGDIVYNIEMKDGIVANGNSVEYTLLPKALPISLGDAGTVYVYVASPVKGTFDKAAQSMNFTLSVDSIYMGAIEEGGIKIELGQISLAFTGVNKLSGVESSAVNTVAVALYPNPVQNVLTVKSDDLIIRCDVVSLNGSVVATQSVNSTEAVINVAHLSDGVYVVKTFTENGVISSKLVKK